MALVELHETLVALVEGLAVSEGGNTSSPIAVVEAEVATPIETAFAWDDDRLVLLGSAARSRFRSGFELTVEPIRLTAIATRGLGS